MNGLLTSIGKGLGDLDLDALRALLKALPVVGEALASVPDWLAWPVLILALGCGLITGFITVFALMAIYAERKISAFMQSRVGPMEVGPWGLLQTLADGVKLLSKEDLIPRDGDRLLFIMGPVIVFAGVFVSFVVLPFGRDLIVVDMNVGLLFLAAVSAVEVVGILMAGWGSNNKWALFGTMRLITQLVSYEIPMGLSFLAVIAISGTLSLQEMTLAQHGWVWSWFVFRNPFLAVGFLVFYVAILAETKRAPFDLPEADSELVAGFHTEYSGMRFSLFFLAEYASMYVVSAVAVVLYLGGWFTGILPVDQWMLQSTGIQRAVANVVGLGTIVFKAHVLVWIMMWLRWTLPRIRLDQVMYVCLKVLLPFSFAVLVLSSLWDMVVTPTQFGEWWPMAQFFVLNGFMAGLLALFWREQRPGQVPDDFVPARQTF